MKPHASAATAVAAFVLASVLVLPSAPAAQSTQDKLDITAFAVNMNNTAAGAAAVVRIRIDAWTTAEDRNKLIATMTEKKPEALVKELNRMKSRGRFSIPGLQGPDNQGFRLGRDLRYAWQTPWADGGRRIVIITDREMSFWEASNQPRSVDYPFTLFEMRVNRDGTGEGKMAAATKITWDKVRSVVEVENYGVEPVRLNEVKVTVRK